MSGDRPVVLVTGATGFVGRHLVPELASQGWLVRPVERRASGAANAVLVDMIGPLTDWSAALAGADAVVHLAARVHHPGDESNAEIYRAVNIEGTLRLAEAAAAAGVRHFIHVSTILVNGGSTDGRGPFRESDQPAPRGIYGQTKAAAEAGLQRLAQGSAMSISIVRPPLVYGPAAGGNFGLLLRTIRRGLPLPFASIRNRRGFVAVGNLTSFIAYRLAHPGSGCEIFLVADDEQVSTPDFIRGIAAACGGKARLFPMPMAVLTLMGRAVGRPEIRDSLIGSMEIDTSKARTIGWRPKYSLAEGLRAAFREPMP